MEGKNLPDYLKQGVAEVELSYKSNSKFSERVTVSDSRTANAFLIKLFDEETIGFRESLFVCGLNKANQIIAYKKLSEGGMSETSADPKIAVLFGLKTNSSGIILCHNHPSGRVYPSTPDINFTKKVKAACKLLDMQLLDHLIVSPEGNYYSFADEGDL